MQTVKVSEEGRGGGAYRHQCRDPPATMEKTMVTQVVSWQLSGVHEGADIHTTGYGGPPATVGGCALKEVAACGEPTLEQAPDRNCGPWRATHTATGFLAEPVAA